MHIYTTPSTFYIDFLNINFIFEGYYISYLKIIDNLHYGVKLLSGCQGNILLNINYPNNIM